MPQFNARYQQKIDTEANWNKAINFIPMKGEFIIYAKDDAHSTERIKIGDGVTPVTQLNFVSSESAHYLSMAEDLEVITLLLNNDMLPVLMEDENTVIAEKDGTMFLI